MHSGISKEECRKSFRRLELEAYGSMISVLRAQGPLTSDKQKLLQQLAKLLHISDERHRCEIRRVANDQNLAAIAEHIHGANTGIDWMIEGRRTIPLLPRLKPRTAFTTLNNSLSLAISASTSNIRPNDCGTFEKSEDPTSLSAESQSEAKIEADLSVKKLYNHENTIESTEVVLENSSLDKDKIDDKVVDEPNASKLSKKRKSPSPLPSTLPNKVLVLSGPSSHTSRTLENKQESQVVHQNVAFPFTLDEISDCKESAAVSEHLSKHIAVSSKRHVVTIKTSTNNTNTSKMVVNTVQNKSRTVSPGVSSSSVLSNPLNKVQTENENTQSTQNIISDSSHLLKHAVAGTTVSSGPGPPQLKQDSTTYKKLPSEQISYSHQSAAKTSVTINSTKIMNMPQYSNTKLSANVIVIQKDAKGVTLSHAGKEVLGKVIMGGKNLCVTSQHNTNSVNIQSNHVSINNGDRTKTVLPTANSSQKTESVKPSIKKDVSDKNEVDSQPFNSSNLVKSESTTVAQSINSYLPKKECDAITIDWESSLRTDPVLAFVAEKEHKKNKDVNASTNSKIVNSLDTSLESKEIFVGAKHPPSTEDNAEDSNREENPDKEEILCSATLKSANVSLENSQYTVNDNSYVLEESSRSIVEHNDS